MDYQDIIDRLYEIQDEIHNLVSEAYDILPHNGGIVERAGAYWLPHVVMAITKRHGYLGGSMVTMDDTIEEIKQLMKEEDLCI